VFAFIWLPMSFFFSSQAKVRILGQPPMSIQTIPNDEEGKIKNTIFIGLTRELP
jgi:hypothetical protein